MKKTGIYKLVNTSSNTFYRIGAGSFVRVHDRSWLGIAPGNGRSCCREIWLPFDSRQPSCPKVSKLSSQPSVAAAAVAAPPLTASTRTHSHSFTPFLSRTCTRSATCTVGELAEKSLFPRPKSRSAVNVG